MDFDEGSSLTGAFEKGTPVTIKPPVTSGGSAATANDGINGTGDAHLATNASGNVTELAQYSLPLASPGVVFTQGLGAATLHFSLRIDTYTAGDGGVASGGAISVFGAIILTDATSSATKLTGSVGVDANAQMFMNLDGAPAAIAIGLPSTGVWHDYDLKLTMSSAGTSASFVVKVDNVSVGTVNSMSFPTLTTPKANFNVGLATLPPFAMFAVRLDNVTFDSL